MLYQCALANSIGSGSFCGHVVARKPKQLPTPDYNIVILSTYFLQLLHFYVPFYLSHNLAYLVYLCSCLCPS